MKNLAFLLLTGFALFGAVGCDVARTSADAPTSIEGEVEEPQDIETTKEDAENNVRQAQLDSDIRAREQRNDLLGEQGERTDADIESEVRAKLEANIPGSKLTIEAEDGAVKIAGTVPDQKEYDTIKPLAEEIVGVDSIDISEVKVVEPTES